MVAKLSFYVHACSCRGWPACPEGSLYVTQTARPNVAIGATDLPADDIFILSNYGEESQLIRKMTRFRCLFEQNLVCHSYRLNQWVLFIFDSRSIMTTHLSMS